MVVSSFLGRAPHLVGKFAEMVAGFQKTVMELGDSPLLRRIPRNIDANWL